MHKIFTTLAITIVLLVAGFYAFNVFIYNEKQGTGEPTGPYRGTLVGEYTCLPHKNTNGPQTLECALGIKIDTGEYYALDFGPSSQTQSKFQTGDRFRANGTITPIELLSTNHWQKYDVEGIFSVTDGVEKL